MKELDDRFWEIFFEVYERLPRQGPGNRACAARALGLCHELPDSPAILDLGCGVGGQTLQLAELTSGAILAIDSHAPSIDRLQAAIAERGLSPRVSAVVGDMARPEQPFGSFDLIWSEGALYSIALRNALDVCQGLLRPGGCLAFTDAVWRKENPPPIVKASFDLDYPTMGWLDDNVAALQDCGFELVGHFTLPDEAWWDDFYTPMEARIAELRGKYAKALLHAYALEHDRYYEKVRTTNSWFTQIVLKPRLRDARPQRLYVRRCKRNARDAPTLDRGGLWPTRCWRSAARSAAPATSTRIRNTGMIWAPFIAIRALFFPLPGALCDYTDTEIRNEFGGARCPFEPHTSAPANKRPLV
jgi:SAM-dependent methyltransferase